MYIFFGSVQPHIFLIHCLQGDQRPVQAANNDNILTLRELPELGEDMGIFWWWNHQNTPIYPLFHGDSQRPNILLSGHKN